MSDWLLKQINRTASKGVATTTVQTPIGKQTQQSVRGSSTKQEVQAAATTTKTDAQTTTQAAATTLQTTKEDVGIQVSFEIKFQNANPIPPEGETQGDGCP